MSTSTHVFRAAFVVAIVLHAVLAQAAPPSIANLGVVAGTTFSEGTGVSRDGTVVVGRSSNRAFRWSAEMGMESLGLLPGANGAFASGTNNDGSVVVGYCTMTAGGTRSFRWTSAGGMTDLGTLPSGPSVSGYRATSVSADGSVVVGSTGVGGEAYRWTAATGKQPVFPDNLHSSFASCVSADGMTVVGNQQWTNAVPFRAVVGSAPLLMQMASGGIASANAVSGDGMVAVGRASTQLGFVPALWDPLGNIETLGRYQGSNPTLKASNYDGSVLVGEASFQAVIWTRSHGYVNLTTLLQSLGVDMTGWELLTGDGISDDGKVITGSAFYNGQTRAYRAVIPAPSMIVSLTMAMGIWASRRRTRCA